MSLPPLSANAETQIELNDSCNCCWGKKKKKKEKDTTREKTQDFVNQLMNPSRDANEVYNLHMSVDISSKRNSGDMTKSRDSDEDKRAEAATARSDKNAATAKATDKNTGTK